MNKIDNLPILPMRTAKDTIDEIKGFVSTMLFARDIDTRTAILEALFERSPIVKGPFVDLKLPFRSANGTWPLDERLNNAKFLPYLHQMRAFERLQSNNSKNTLITTGTGSGKSECFIMPILDYVLQCKVNGKENGVKALIIYPMNALIEDQGERLSQLANELNQTLPENLKIRVGRYNRNSGSVTKHDPKNPKLIVDNRDSLCANPPDILLTNFKMLDYMLLRPEEQSFWTEPTKACFKYLVLDELHTFDGAQGADVACLIRRLRLKIGTDFTCIGTSATVGDGSKKSINDLCEFAGTLFGSDFTSDDVIGEDRLNPKEVLQSPDKKLTIPSEPAKSIDLIVEGSDGYLKYIDALSKNWKSPTSPVGLGTWVVAHPLTHLLVNAIRPGMTTAELASACETSEVLLVEFLDLISYSRKSGKFPLFPISSQLWIQSVPYLMRKLDAEPKFLRAESEEFQEVSGDIYLPAVNCRECGISGWATKITRDPASDKFILEDNPSKIRTSFHRDNDAAFIFPKTSSVTNHVRTLFATPTRLSLSPNGEEREGEFQVVIADQKVNGTSLGKGIGNNCPSCESSNSMGISVFGDSMMGSVVANSFLASGANPTDKKYLIFNDSLQDTAHQAGYLSARGFRFNFRRYILKHVLRDDRIDTLHNLIKRVRSEIENLWSGVRKSGNSARDELSVLMQIIPKDLWERWTTKSNKIPFSDNSNLHELLDRVDWECWLEFSTVSELGWSLRKTTLVALEPNAETFLGWLSTAKALSQTKEEWRKIADLDSFVYGIVRRLVTQGAISREDLAYCYKQTKFSYWPLINAKPYLASFFYPRSPRIISLEAKASSGKKPPLIYMTSDSSSSWFVNWAGKHGISKSSAPDFYLQFLTRLSNSDFGLVKVNPLQNDKLLAIDSDKLEIHWKKTKLMRCDHCNHMSAVAVSINSLKCTQMHCPGAMSAIQGEQHKAEESNFLSYMARQYERGIIAPFAHAHNSQLQGDDRQKVEQAFKRNLLPGDSLNESGQGRPYYTDHPINVLTCTPTMEMGIDIGTLSGVALRSFPRTLANAKQRLGRAGRSSGNAFNVVISQQKPHDNHFWTNPKSFFAGQIRAPGCEFRNTQILLRQFNAFCLDKFSELNPELRIPRLANEDLKSVFSNIYYVRLFLFLNTETKNLIEPFADCIFLKANKSVLTKKGLVEFLQAAVAKGEFESSIKDELNEMVNSRVNAENLAKGVETKLPALENAEDRIENKEQEDKAIEAIEVATRKKNYLNFVRSQQAEPEYLLKRLGDKGILPNYAFPEEGVRMDYSVRLPVDRQGKTFRERYRFKQGQFQRGPLQALLELAPGGSYYTDGFKVPVTRLETDSKAARIKAHICCSACGALTPYSGSQRSYQHCPACNESDQPITNLLDLRTVTGQAEFSVAQIIDAEEQRERKSVRLETFINHAAISRKGSDSAVWFSPSAHIALEFRVNAEIHHLNRNLKFREDQPTYFDVCSECKAVPVRIVEGKADFKDRGVNRHSNACSFRQAEDVEMMKVSLGRTLFSDTISFLVDGTNYSPTLHALLSYSMQIYLKGSPAHLVISNSKLRVDDRGHRHIMSLYDNVPGGTGHLRSLMQFKKEDLNKETSGLITLKGVFERTLKNLQDCSCKTGCYSCLLNYENQFSHSSINKEYAENWLKRFIGASDWEPRAEALAIAAATESSFDSIAEEYFVDGIRRAQHTIPGAESCREPHDSNQPVFEIRSPNLKKHTSIIHTAFDNVQLNGRIPYTRPDFTIYRDGKISGYIYVDGRDPHLSPGQHLSVFESRDVEIRTSLFNQTGLPVLVFSHDMVNWWREAVSYNRKINMGTPQPVPALYKIFSRLAPNQTNQYSLENFKADMKELAASFVAFQMSQACGISAEGYLSNFENEGLRKYIKEHLAHLKVGGLQYDSKTKKIEMDASSKKRLDAAGNISEDFKLSWELFWILWQLVPDCVQILPSPTAKESA